MISWVRDGKLSPEPRSIKAAESRIKQLQHEMDRIQKQLDDPARRCARFNEFEQWRAAAERAHSRFAQEQVLLRAWIAGTQEEAPARQLLRRAHSIFIDLRAEVDLEDYELEFIDDLEKFLTKGVLPPPIRYVTIPNPNQTKEGA